MDNYMSYKINLFGYDWWVYNHTKWDSSRYDDAYFGTQGVAEGVNPSSIRLYIENAPMRFNRKETEPSENGEVVKHLCCGEVNGPTMSYGTYKWKVIMPTQKHLWPALWLCGKHSWPPEIDVVEGYTQDRGDYVKNWLTTTLETNFHMRRNMKAGTHINIGAKGIPTFIYKLFKKDIDEYKCVWTPYCVKIYFNGILIRSITNKKFLADINVCPEMYPIMNIMVDNGYVHDEKNRPHLDIMDFSYTPMK